MAQNRLRVGLARIRRFVQLDEIGDRVGIAAGSVEVDLVELRTALARASDSVDVSAEYHALKALSPQLAANVLVGFTDPWAQDEQSAWSLEAVQALTRLAELAQERGEYGTVLDAVSSGLSHIPDDEELWRQYLEAAARRGEIQGAVRKWERRRSTLRREGSDFSAELITAVGELRSPDLGSELALTVGQEELMRRWAVRCFDEDPALMMSVLASPSFLPEIARKPAECLPLLRLSLAGNAEPSFARERCEVNALRARIMLEDETALDEAEALLATPLAADNRRLLLLNLSFLSFFYGRPQRAFQQIRECIDICSNLGLDYELCLARCQLASFLWTTMDLEKSAGLYREMLVYLDEVRDRDVATVVAVVQANYAAVLMELDEPVSALAAAQAADQIARQRGAADAEARASSAIARASFSLGQEDVAFEASIRAIKRAHRLGIPRLQVNVLEFIALGMVKGTRVEPGRRLLRFVWSLRRGLGLPQDMIFGSWFERYLPEEPAPAPRSDVSEVMVLSYRELSEIRRRAT